MNRTPEVNPDRPYGIRDGDIVQTAGTSFFNNPAGGLYSWMRYEANRLRRGSFNRNIAICLMYDDDLVSSHMGRTPWHVRTAMIEALMVFVPSEIKTWKQTALEHDV